RRDDRGRHPGQQDGPGAAQDLRPDARPQVGHLHGQLRQRRRLLPLFLLGRAWLRSDRAGRHLRAGLPADRRGAGLRHPAAAEEDPPRHQLRARAPGWARMNQDSQSLADRLRERFPTAGVVVSSFSNEVTLEVADGKWLDVAFALRDEFGFEQLTAVSGVDYLGYGSVEWDVGVSSEGFSRGVRGNGPGRFKAGQYPNPRSEERRVGKECRAQWCAIGEANE